MPTSSPSSSKPTPDPSLGLVRTLQTGPAISESRERSDFMSAHQGDALFEVTETWAPPSPTLSSRIWQARYRVRTTGWFVSAYVLRVMFQNARIQESGGPPIAWTATPLNRLRDWYAVAYGNSEAGAEQWAANAVMKAISARTITVDAMRLILAYFVRSYVNPETVVGGLIPPALRTTLNVSTIETGAIPLLNISLPALTTPLIWGRTPAVPYSNPAPEVTVVGTQTRNV